MTKLAPIQPQDNLKYNDVIINETLKWKKSGLLRRGRCLLTQKLVGRHNLKKMIKCRIITDTMRM